MEAPEGAVREASPTSYSAAYDLVFQADGPLPPAAQSWLPDYALEAVQATGTLTVTIQITKTEEAPWAYTLVSAADHCHLTRGPAEQKTPGPRGK